MNATIAALERVFGAFDNEHGVPAIDLDAAERELGVRLPAALRRLYERTGRHPLHTAEHRIVEPAQLGFKGDHLVIYEENQGACVWGIAAGSLSADDPPVDMLPNTQGGVEVVAEFASVSQFLAFQAAHQAVATLPFSGLILPPSTLAHGRKLEPRKSVSRAQGKVVGEQLSKMADADVRIRPGAIALITSDGYFSLAAKDEATFRAVTDALHVVDDDWDYFSPLDE